jgi:hypothetical protein
MGQRSHDGFGGRFGLQGGSVSGDAVGGGNPPVIAPGFVELPVLRLRQNPGRHRGERFFTPTKNEATHPNLLSSPIHIAVFRRFRVMPSGRGRVARPVISLPRSEQKLRIDPDLCPLDHDGERKDKAFILRCAMSGLEVQGKGRHFG